MKKVLVIEDEEFVRDNLVELLELENYEAISAPDGLAGIQLAQHHLPDLILCDMMMPLLDGHQVLQALKQATTTATIPFVFLTAKSHKTDTELGLALGANDYLTKPYTAADLLNVVSRLLN
ncbi:response regulator transcription factor [Leptolyngbya sp. AN02str]|uniref:response regulator transcription factor n=1 Tax=Leptolyngbya sp. AN02str TaxID=3423363 RepID=UPI003D315A8B